MTIEETLARNGIEIPKSVRDAGAQDVVTRYPGMQSARETRTVAAGVMPTAVVSAHSFPVRSVRIDNFSNQWLQLGEENDFISPYALGVIRNVRGKVSIEVRPNAPVPVIQGAAVAGEFYVITLYDKPQMQGGGYGNAGGASSLQDRVQTLFDVATVAGNAQTLTATGTILIASICVTYVATATAVNRQLQLRLLNAAGHPFWSINAGTTQPFSTTGVYNFSAGVVREATGSAFVGTGTGTKDILVPLPEGCELQAGDQIQIRELSGAADPADTMAIVVHGRRELSLG